LSGVYFGVILYIDINNIFSRWACFLVPAGLAGSHRVNP